MCDDQVGFEPIAGFRLSFVCKRLTALRPKYRRKLSRRLTDSCGTLLDLPLRIPKIETGKENDGVLLGAGAAPFNENSTWHDDGVDLCAFRKDVLERSLQILNDEFCGEK